MQTGIGASAYLKVAEGCDHTCSFCIIPMLRGKFRSRTIESLVIEARVLVASGTKEIILISQDTTYYHLLNFIRENEFDRLGVFTYSRQTEVPSGNMEDQIPERVKKERRRKIMEAQHEISSKRVEGFDEAKKLFYGRTQWDAPQIDNQVYQRRLAR